MKLSSSIIGLSLVFSFSVLAKEKRKPATAPVTPATTEKTSSSCATDTVKFCPHSDKDGVGTCLHSHETELSDSCRIDLKSNKQSKK